MKFSNTSVMNFNGSFRGLRNPKNSWSRSDSEFNVYYDTSRGDLATSELLRIYPSAYIHHKTQDGYFADIIGDKDLKLAQTLIKAGNEHRKFMRQIFVSVDITAPLYWWKEMDQYRINVTTNSTSTMHKLATTPITLDCFETDDYDRNLSLADNPKDDDGLDNISTFEEDIIYVLENIRQKYLETKDKRYWKELVRWLPESWLQKRTTTMNYENVRNMYFQRRYHKLTEWSESFIKWVESLPYAEELIMYEGGLL